MSRSTCWHCNESIGSSYNYCGDCGAPVSEFQKRAGEGFLRRESLFYLNSILEGSLEYPSDSSLGDELEKSLQEQLKEDIRMAIIELAAVCRLEGNVLLQSIDADFLQRSLDGEEITVDDLTPSFVGLARITSYLVHRLPERFIEILSENPEF